MLGKAGLGWGGGWGGGAYPGGQSAQEMVVGGNVIGAACGGKEDENVQCGVQEGSLCGG